MPSPANLLTLRALPLPTDPRSIQQREAVVKEIYVLLVDSKSSAVVLTGIGGIGKSTLASLVLNHAERERRAGRGPFRSEPVLLRINENTPFLELAANIFAAVGRSIPDLSNALPQNQAFAVFNTLDTKNTADTPRLIILDQFENLLEKQSGRPRSERPGVGEFLDALNSQPCAFSIYREAVLIDAAQAVSASVTKAQALTNLGSLLEQHLIQAQAASGHYQLHPIVATYAQQHFVVDDEAANTQARRAAHAKAARYYLHVAAPHCPPRDKRRRTGDVQPLIEAVWQLSQAGQFQEAYERMEREVLFDDLSRWGENTGLLELCRLLLSENWQFTPGQQALIYTYIARTSETLGRKQEAVQYYEQALRIRREVGDRGGEGTTLNNLGSVYNVLGQKQLAVQYYLQALELHKMVQNPFTQGITLHNIGIMYSGQSRHEVALACILLAKALFELVQSPSNVKDEEQEIASLRKSIGEKPFTTLLVRVEPQAEQIVEEALGKGRASIG